jgi:PAS domain S-box-containing protein
VSNITERREPAGQGDEAFRLLVESVKDYSIIMLDPTGRVTSWNEGAARIKGYSAGEIIGQSFTRFYPDEANAAEFPAYELKVAAETGRFEDENWRVRKDGSQFWANVVITALHNPDGELIGFAKVTRDLTARREAEEQARRLAAEEAARAEADRQRAELSRINESLAQALAGEQEARVAAEHATDAMKQAYNDLDQFAYVASHDLKAPLRGIANLAQWVQEDVGDQLTGESANHVRLLQGRVLRMEALIDGILAYSRAGRRMTEPEEVDTGMLLKDVIDLLAPPDEVTIEVPDKMPVLHAERVPLQQVFLNLIGNAVKYTRAVRDDGHIEVRCRDIGDVYEFSVKDNGPGIEPRFHDRIWGIFQTLSTRDQVEGTGIGLSVVKKVVESRGGSIAVESTPGEGATFRFTWPKN